MMMMLMMMMIIIIITNEEKIYQVLKLRSGGMQYYGKGINT